MKKLPGWQGHHKFYMGLVALIAVTVWLIIALFVWEVEFPEDIVGCAAVVFEVTLKVGLFAFIFQRYVAGEGPVVAPTDPEGKVGQAPNLHAWSRAVFELDQKEVRAKGGVDAALHVRRVRMRLACLEVWALLAFPLAVVFALDPKRCVYRDRVWGYGGHADFRDGCPYNCGFLCMETEEARRRRGDGELRRGSTERVGHGGGLRRVPALRNRRYRLLPLRRQGRALGPRAGAGLRPHQSDERALPRGRHGRLAALGGGRRVVVGTLGRVPHHRRARPRGPGYYERGRRRRAGAPLRGGVRLSSN